MRSDCPIKAVSYKLASYQNDSDVLFDVVASYYVGRAIAQLIEPRLKRMALLRVAGPYRSNRLLNDLSVC